MSLVTLILAGGFAKRFKPLSDYVPKPLFPVGGVPLIYHIIEKALETGSDEIIISTNKKYEHHFRHILASLYSFYEPSQIGKIRLVIEPSNSEENKLGSIGGLHYAIKEMSLNDNLLILLGDNLFSFNLNKIIKLGNENNSIALAIYDIKNYDDAKNYGIVKIENNMIKEFYEKPQNPLYTTISTGIYYIPKIKLYLLDEYMNSNYSKDSMGNFFEYLIKKGEKLYGHIYGDDNEYWFDIGTIDSYQKANNFANEKGLYRRWIWP
ncbi:MAG: nucleotidyltransferase family protein [Candidatus Nanopusillus sp.]